MVSCGIPLRLRQVIGRSSGVRIVQLGVLLRRFMIVCLAIRHVVMGGRDESGRRLGRRIY